MPIPKLWAVFIFVLIQAKTTLFSGILKENILLKMV